MSLDVVILAAGKGTRMKSKTPKVLHLLAGKPFVLYSVTASNKASGEKPVLVIGHEAEAVKEAVGDQARFVYQEDQLGTGHAVAQTRTLLKNESEHIIVIYGDMPLLRAETLTQLYEFQKSHDGPFSMLTQVTNTPRNFGRIIRNSDGYVEAIVEESDATPEELLIKEVNLGIYCFDANWLWEHLEHIPLNPKGEYYLTDLVSIAVNQGKRINATILEDPTEAIGINNRVHLADAEFALRERINAELMLAGVTIIDTKTTYIHSDVSIGQDTVIYPNTIIEGDTKIGEDCVLGPNTIIRDSRIGDYCKIEASVVEEATLENHVDVGPYGHLRKGAYLEEGVHMGNFGEVKNSRLHKGVKMGHFSYIGDGDIGENTNIGAGTITCNYDGEKKHKTIIGKNVFIGSDTMLVAPLSIGDGGRTGAGSVVTSDVPANKLVYGVPARSKEEHTQSKQK